MSNLLPPNWDSLEDSALWDELNKPKPERRRSNGFSATSSSTLFTTPPPEQKPELVINQGDLTATAKELATRFAKRTDFLFNGNAPVRIAVEDDYMPYAVELTVDAIRVHTHEICSPVKPHRGRNGEAKLVPVSLARDIAQIYLSGLEGQWHLKPFRGITTAPILDNDGDIRVAAGYDVETGLWAFQLPTLNIPERPTEADAKAALHRLREFFRTFPFADGARAPELDPDLGAEVIDLTKTPGLDESIFLNALLSAVVRPSIVLCPGFLCDAPNLSGAGSGKGLLVRAVCIIASNASPAAFTSGHDVEELDKRLTAALIEARPAVFLDNFNAKELKSDILASALTENPVEVRVLGHSKTVPLCTRTFIGITGNGVEIAEDMARRILKTRLDAKMEDPEQRKFAPGFLDRVRSSRSALLSDALTIWRWGRQTVLKPGKPLGSYEVWAQWVRDPLLALGCKDPVDRIAEIKANDPRRRAAVDFFEVWWAIHNSMIIKVNDVGIEVAQQIDDKATRKDDGSIVFNRQKVALFLRSLAGTRVGGYSFSQIKDGIFTKRPIAHYKLERKDG
jgi:hypothetical protein